MKVEQKPVEHYAAYLKDKYRPPSKGGNTGSWHQHVIRIDGKNYSFLARGRRKWVYAKDLVTFEWDWDQSQKYRNVRTDSLFVIDKAGEKQFRGDRSSKPWRTASTRLPVSRREALG